MNFRRQPPAPSYRILRLVSEGGRWELGLNDYRDGLRLRMGHCGKPPAVMDFCLGHRREIWWGVLAAVLRRLAGIGEAATADEIDALFPWAGGRPDLAVHLDALLVRDGECICPATDPRLI